MAPRRNSSRNKTHCTQNKDEESDANIASISVPDIDSMLAKGLSKPVPIDREQW